MNNKIKSGVTLLLALCLSFLFSCDKDDDKKPTKPSISLKEVGKGNSKTVLAGKDLHLDAEIIADGLIKQIDLEIHQEEGGNFEIEKTFTDVKYVGVKNADFHEHVDIPAEAPAGEYHLHLKVTDQAGQTTTAESELIITAPAEN